MNYLHSDKIRELESKSDEIRKSISEDILEDNSEYTSKYLRMVDVLTLLYFHILKYNPKDKNQKDHDRLIFSNRDIYPALYATLSHAGYFPTEELKTLREFDTCLQDTAIRALLPNIETSPDSQGSLSQAVGMVLADKINRGGSSNKFFYYLWDDKELQEAQNWEAVALAGKKQLHNLIAFIDKNDNQIGNFMKEEIPFESLVNKFEAANWHVLSADKHDFDDLDNVIGQGQAVFAKPTVIIA